MLDHTRFSIFCHLLPTSMVRALPRFTRIESCNYLFTKQLTKTEKMAIEIFFFFRKNTSRVLGLWPFTGCFRDERTREGWCRSLRVVVVYAVL
jgi:hypothetical protein